MSTLAAIRTGILRALASPFLLLGLWLANFAVAVPATWVTASSIRDAIGDSRVQERLRDGFDEPWFGEYQAAADGIEETFTPAVVGAGAFYENLEAWITGDLFRQHPELVALGVSYAVLWSLLLGGVVDRYARPGEKTGPRRYLRATVGYFPRFLRLAALSSGLYVLVYLMMRELFEALEPWMRDETSESVAMFYSLSIWLLGALLLTLIHLVFGYARVAAVVDERRSMMLATLRGFLFVLMHPARTLGAYYGLSLLSVGALAVYSFVAPGPGQATPRAMLLAFGAGQLLLLFRLAMRLSSYGAQAALYTSLTGDRARSKTSTANAQEA